MGDAEKNGDQNLPIGDQNRDEEKDGDQKNLSTDDQNRPLNVQENLNVDQQPLNVDQQNQVQNPNLDQAEANEDEESEEEEEDAEKKEGGDSEEEEENQDSAADNFEGGVGAAAQLKVEEAEAEVPPAAKKLKVEHDVSSVEVKMEEAAEVKVEKAEAGSTDKGKGIKVEEDSTAMKAETDVKTEKNPRADKGKGIKIEEDSTAMKAETEVKTEKEGSPLSFKENARADIGKGIKVEEVKAETGVKTEKKEQTACRFFNCGGNVKMLLSQVEVGMRLSVLEKNALKLAGDRRYFTVTSFKTGKAYSFSIMKLKDGYCTFGGWDSFAKEEGVKVGEDVWFNKDNDGRLWIFVQNFTSTDDEVVAGLMS